MVGDGIRHHCHHGYYSAVAMSKGLYPTSLCSCDGRIAGGWTAGRMDGMNEKGPFARYAVNTKLPSI